MLAKTRFLTAAALMFAVAACSEDGTGPNGDGNSLDATVAGEAGFNPPEASVAGTYVNNNLTIQGSHTSGGKTVTIQINLAGITTEDEYLLNQNVAGRFGQVSVLENSALSLWTTAVAPGSGSVDITTLTSTRAAGTFEFTAQASPGTPATNTKAVTSGSFDIEF